MNTDDGRKRDLAKDYAHKELREVFENAVKFVALAILLIWARSHTQSIHAWALFTLSLILCMVAATLRLVCILNNPTVEQQLKKERPWLAKRAVHKGDVYGLLGGALVLVAIGLGTFLYFFKFQ
jgi:hypothetical protein